MEHEHPVKLFSPKQALILWTFLVISKLRKYRRIYSPSKPFGKETSNFKTDQEFLGYLLEGRNTLIVVVTMI